MSIFRIGEIILKLFKQLPFLFITSSFIFLSTSGLFGTDIYGPKPFHQILESDFTETWTPESIPNIENRKHVLLLDTGMSNCLSVDNSATPNLTVTELSILTGGSGNYGTILQSMFQLLDLNTANLATEDLSDTYTLHPELYSYYAIDADADPNTINSTDLTVRDKSSYYMSEQNTIGFLVFTFTGSSSSSKIQAVKRYIYEINSNEYLEDQNWSSTQWLVMNDSYVQLTNNEADATNFFIADANDIIDVSISLGSDFNPGETSWQTNSFASYPIDANTGDLAVWDYDESQLNTDIYEKVDTYYHTQFGAGTDAATAASQALDDIENTLVGQGGSLQYSKNVYLTFRESMLNNQFTASHMFNSRFGEQTVAHVYFTNAMDEANDFHPFMVIASHDGTAGPNFLIDVPKPPGDGVGEGYPNQSVTRNAILEHKLVKIPLRDYGRVSNLTDNDFSEFGSLALDKNLPESEWNVYNHASKSSSGIAVNGIVIYPASNDQLAFATAVAEITSTGIHVGQGMGLHYHADGHGFNSNGINLYNLSDYEGHIHPPIIGFGFDGIALFGKYESMYSTMEGFDESLDEYGGHIHDDYGYHYHAFAKGDVTQMVGPDEIGPYQQHFLFVGAWNGLINDIPGFLEVSTNQWDNQTIGKYIGATGTVLGTAHSSLTTFPVEVEISQNFPNPFNPITTFRLDLPEAMDVQLIVFNNLGQKVKTLLNKKIDPGIHDINWNGLNDEGSQLPTGMYFYQISAGEFQAGKKLVLLK